LSIENFKPSKALSCNEDGLDSIGQRRKHSSDGLEDRSKQRRKKLKYKKVRSPTPEDSDRHDKRDKVAVTETEEEYDARLEKEENGRRGAERKKELERIKKQYEDDAQHGGGVRFKGRLSWIFGCYRADSRNVRSREDEVC
jgi:peptidyl-prolyl isomerase G (cyclophilin G)